MKARPIRERFNGQTEHYIDCLHRYCTYLENKNEQLALYNVSNTEGKLQAVDDLVEFARNNCREWNNDEMEEIIDRL